MLGPLEFAARSAPGLAVAALLCWAALPGAASAQTASNLNCKKCVGTKELGKKAVTRNRLKNDAVNFRKLHPSVEGAIKQDRAFYVTLDSSGEEATLITQGPLRLFVRCFVDVGNEDRLEIVLTSTTGGWFVLGESAPRAAGEELIFEDASVVTGTTATGPVALNTGALAPDGSTINAFPLLGIGFNIFGHVCLVSGTAAGFTGNP